MKKMVRKEFITDKSPNIDRLRDDTNRLALGGYWVVPAKCGQEASASRPGGIKKAPLQ